MTIESALADEQWGFQSKMLKMWLDKQAFATRKLALKKIKYSSVRYFSFYVLKGSSNVKLFEHRSLSPGKYW